MPSVLKVHVDFALCQRNRFSNGSEPFLKMSSPLKRICAFRFSTASIFSSNFLILSACWLTRFASPSNLPQSSRRSTTPSTFSETSVLPSVSVLVFLFAILNFSFFLYHLGSF